MRLKQCKKLLERGVAAATNNVIEIGKCKHTREYKVRLHRCGNTLKFIIDLYWIPKRHAANCIVSNCPIEECKQYGNSLVIGVSRYKNSKKDKHRYDFGLDTFCIVHDLQILENDITTIMFHNQFDIIKN